MRSIYLLPLLLILASCKKYDCTGKEATYQRQFDICFKSDDGKYERFSPCSELALSVCLKEELK